MFQFNLAQEFKRRAPSTIPFPRGVVSTAAASLARWENTRAGAFAALGAVALGGLLMTANFARERHAVPVVEAAAPAAPVKEAVAPAPAPTPDPIAAAVAATPFPVAEKTTMRIDTTATGAIAEKPALKPKHKKHPKKAKELDSNP